MIHNITVLGMGTIGHACALHFALHGYPVQAYDTNPKALDAAYKTMRAELAVFCEEGLVKPEQVEEILAQIEAAGALEAAVANADYVLECIPEDLAQKQQLFARLEGLAKPGAVMASNTSSLKLADITRDMSDAGKARSLLDHWYNPGHVMPIVELSCFGNMPEKKYAEVETMYRGTGKQPVKVKKDVPGLVANRIQHAVAREVFAMMAAGVADAEDIDRALMYGPAFRYATTGQLEVADFGGLDMWCRAADNLLPDMDDAKEANPLLRQKVQEGKLGAKSGEGFYTYAPGEKEEKLKAFNRRLVRQMKASKEYGK